MTYITAKKNTETLIDASCEVKGKAAPLLINQALRHEDVRGSGCIDPRFLCSRNKCGGIQIYFVVSLPECRAKSRHIAN
jgi:hypothetical protein